MKRSNFFIILIVGLLIVNIIMVLHLFYRNEPPTHRLKPKEIIIERLQFNKEQIEIYEKSIIKFQDKIHITEKKLMNQKKQLYSNLKNNDKVNDSILVEIGNTYSEMEAINYIHFEAIKAICDDQQLILFNELVDELGRLFSPPPRGKQKKN